MQKNIQTSQFEFVALMASLMSVVALAIDALLPALEIIGISIGTTAVVDNQLLITMIFLGLGFGPLIFGPLSDSLGRKPVVYMGFALFICASFICVNATSLEMMVVGRILQGIGLSAPRTISIAIIRDMYSGDYMARIMSFVTVVFILVPVIAPALGKFVLDYYNWHGIFYIQVVISLLVSFWFWKRQPETLSLENKKGFSATGFIGEFKELFKFKKTVGFTIISGFITGSFMVYLSSSQQIFQNQYHLEEEFPYIFAGLAIAIGAAVFSNGVLVIKYGMEKLITVALVSFFVVSATYVALFYNSPNPDVRILILFFGLQFFSIGFLFGNIRAMAMEPVGHIAGTAAAVTGCISTIMAVPISIFIGRFIADTALPLFVGFSICAALAIGLLIYLKNNEKRTVKALSD
ncbi:multidrug effflux MFS transporter [Flavobacterium frigoris]|uniref:MFS transporter, DHA1 family, bicyclomycin/chloramphenicol resistance protein n=1 Tax=Flavobacterium frigoris TaxID=229204 RepID=A0A1H9CJL3_FLAFI|nr:multidrug effflux MFS transporter [Flavobacterium frigoris]SEQ01392.1 MFS transporter, DHA1 family, bicyclomycin/chloramphenicol resistance protein [Flavobacterium frigoris]